MTSNGKEARRKEYGKGEKTHLTEEHHRRRHSGHRLLPPPSRIVVPYHVLIIIYINNRYECQLQLIEIDNLKKELIDIKYDALTRSSELMERSRQSRIEEYIATKESDLQTSTNPPYLLK